MRNWIDIATNVLVERVIHKLEDSSGLETAIHENPPLATIRQLFTKTTDVRAIIEDDSHIIVWNGYDLTHWDVVQPLGISGIECHLREWGVEIDNVDSDSEREYAEGWVAGIRSNKTIVRLYGHSFKIVIGDNEF